jgi:alkanesulfonate monooxygenase SsuD/methylene tetrahydromethanopterin reductase-like flavin-dependent oxidoreductase (luciferase family)
VKFGVFFVTESPDRDFKRAYEEMLEQVEFAEHLGFDTVWLAEHHGSTYGSMPSGSVMAAAIAQRTKFIRIGMAVSILPFNNPVRIAEEYAMVDVLSNGRLDFGVGRGYQPGEYEMLGLADRQARSREIFQESLDIIIGLWTEDRFSYHGSYYEINNATLHPRPLQKPHPPIFVAAISPETFALVAEKGYNILVTPTLMALPELKEFIVDAKRRLVAHGRDPSTIDFPMNWQMHLARSAEEAKARTVDAFGWYFDKVMELVPRGAKVPKTYEAYAEMARAYEAAGGFPIETLQEMGVIVLGDSDEATRRIAEVRDEAGINRISCWFRIGGLEHHKVMDSMEIFAREVMPKFSESASFPAAALPDGAADAASHAQPSVV